MNTTYNLKEALGNKQMPPEKRAEKQIAQELVALEYMAPENILN